MAAWSGKVVLVTGASRGIGLATARAFAARGASVMLAARSEAELLEAVGALTAAGAEAAYVVADVTAPADVDRMVAETVARFGGIDVLVNNAGRSMRRPVAQTTVEDFRVLMELNFFALVSCTLAALPHIEARRGHIVNVSSLAGKSAARYLGAYPATKFAVTAYSQQLRLELADKGIHVLVVCPGPVDTGIIRASLKGEDLSGVPERSRRPGAGLKTRALKADELAGEIVDACEARRLELVFPKWGRILLTLQQLSPGLADLIVRTVT